MKMELWKTRMENIKNVKTPEWNIEQLDEVLKSLKNNKTYDPHLMINELFKAGCIGEDMEEALLLLFNGIKEELNLPEYFKFGDIISIYKNKGGKI